MDWDLLIIGGGINGTAIARDAAGRGLKVLLCERDDLANHTSSSSTKLIHGGLRYLEYYEFRLVREALIERETLLRSAPFIIKPMQFILPYDRGLRPAWLLRLGLFFYDRLGGRQSFPTTKTVKLSKAPFAGILENRLKKGFEYADCWVDDARLTVLNAIDAAHRGADIKTRTELISIKPIEGGYHAQIKSARGVENIQVKAVVNAAGPWVDKVLEKIQPCQNTQSLQQSVRLIKGSHIVTKKLFDGDFSFIFQNADNRIIFAIPYETDYTLIGTTDQPYDFDEGEVKISDSEISYLCKAASEYLKKDISPSDVVWTYAGVRPLYDDKAETAAAVTRDYVLNIDELSTGAPFLSVYGGKITTSRKLAEHAMEKLSLYLDVDPKGWTQTAILPGGDIPNMDFGAFFAQMQSRYKAIDQALLYRLCRHYGTRITLLLGDKSTPDLGQHFGAGFYAAEARYLIAHEYASQADDILWRRTKRGLHMSETEQKAFARWLHTQLER